MLGCAERCPSIAAPTTATGPFSIEATRFILSSRESDRIAAGPAEGRCKSGDRHSTRRPESGSARLHLQQRRPFNASPKLPQPAGLNERSNAMNAHSQDLLDRRRLQGRRHLAGRLRPQGTRHRRARNAGPDVDPQEVRRRQAARRRARHRLAAHDDPDRGADRDAEGHRRRRALGVVQHLLHPGPRRRRDRQDRHAGVRVEGRVAGRILGLHARRADLPGQRRRQVSRPAAGGRRRRRRHAADPQGLRARERQQVGRRESRLARGTGDQEPAQARRSRTPGLLARRRARLEGRVRGDHHRRASPVPDGRGRQPAGAGDQRQRLGHQVASSTTSTAAASRWPTASSARWT